MNKKLNIALILLIVGLISTMGAANASPISDTSYEIVSHDVTVKQGKTATITAQLLEHSACPLGSTKRFINGALLCFIVKDKDGQFLAGKLAQTDDSWWNPYLELLRPLEVGDSCLDSFSEL